RRLEGRVAAGVVAGVVVGEAVDLARVRGLVTEQVQDSEVQPATAAEDFVADRILHGPGVGGRIGFGERDGNLHRAAGLYRIAAGKQPFAHRHASDQVLVEFAELTLGAHARQALAVAATVGGWQPQPAIDQQARDAQRGGTAIDLAAGNARQPGDRRIGLVARLLFDHRQHGADVLHAGRYALRGERDLDIARPAGPVLHRCRDPPLDLVAQRIR